MKVTCPNCSAVAELNADLTDALANQYKLFCPIIREQVIKERALLREIECPHMADAIDAAILELRRVG